jgi:Spy/CpxP family protein refolding chaperone
MIRSSRLCAFAVAAVVATAVAAPASSTPGRAGAAGKDGKAGAPGQVCKHLKVKGKKTDAQRAAFKECIHDAVAKRQG